MVTFHIISLIELRLCTCEDLYYRKLSNNRAGRICKHLAFTPRDNNFELNLILLPGVTMQLQQNKCVLIFKIRTTRNIEI